MKRVLFGMPILYLALIAAAQAADALELAITHMRTQQTRALAAVAVAERGVAEAQVDLSVARGIETEAQRVHDRAAIAVAAEAVQQALALTRETQRNLDMARALLATHGKTLDNLLGWERVSGRPRAVLVTEAGAVRHRSLGGDMPSDVVAMGAGDTVQTGSDGRARLFVSSGDGEVVLGANSTYSVTRDDASGTFEARLEQGFMRLRLLVKEKFGRKFEVRTPSAVTSVRGTDYSVRQDPQGEVIRVYSGVVAVAPPGGGGEVLVTAGKSLTVPLQGTWPAPQPTQANAAELSWSPGDAQP